MHRILIVEDEPSTAWALAEGLSDDGFSIETRPSAEEAWSLLQRDRFDLVISDLRLPGMSGLDLARKLARSRRNPPVIILTAYGSPETLRALADAGVLECFPKPFAMDALRHAVHRSLRRAVELRRVHPQRRAA